MSITNTDSQFPSVVQHETKSMSLNQFINEINSGTQITIVSTDKRTNSEVARLYFYLYHNPLYYNKISVSKTIITNHKNRTSVHGKVTKKEQLAQIHFVNVAHLEKWMLESCERLNGMFQNEDSVKKYQIHSKVRYKQRLIVLLDNTIIPPKLDPGLVVTSNVVESVKHHEWKLYLGNLVKKYNELKSKYFIERKTRVSRKKAPKSLFSQFAFKPLTEEEKLIIKETDESMKIHVHETECTEEQLQAQIRIQALLPAHFNVTNTPEEMPGLSDLENLEKRILEIYGKEPSDTNETVFTSIDSLDLCRLGKIKFMNMLVSMPETRLLNRFMKYALTPANSLLFNVATNNLPQLINYRSPDYLNVNAWKDIHILRIDYAILSSDFKIIKQQSHYISNPNIHNTIKFEVVNKITDEYRNEHGISFIEVARCINSFISEFNIKYLITHSSDVNYNLLLCEYERNMIDLDIFKNLVILNTKQYLWKRDVTERMEDFEECKGCKTKLDMIYNLLRSRLMI